MWTLLLTGISAILFFSFVLICIKNFGIQSCYSAYGSLWSKKYPPINIWSVVTFITAVLLIPVILEVSSNSPWQAIAFFCPALLMFVSVTPDYEANTFVHLVHSISAGISAILAIIFIFIMVPHLWWIIAVYLLIATVLMFIFGTKSAMLWYEMVAYASIYTAMFILTSSIPV